MVVRAAGRWVVVEVDDGLTLVAHGVLDVVAGDEAALVRIPDALGHGAAVVHHGPHAEPAEGIVVRAPGDGVQVVGVEAAVARDTAAAGVVAAAAAGTPEVLALHAALRHVHADRVLASLETGTRVEDDFNRVDRVRRVGRPGEAQRFSGAAALVRKGGRRRVGSGRDPVGGVLRRGAVRPVAVRSNGRPSETVTDQADRCALTARRYNSPLQACGRRSAASSKAATEALGPQVPSCTARCSRRSGSSCAATHAFFRPPFLEEDAKRAAALTQSRRPGAPR